MLVGDAARRRGRAGGARVVATRSRFYPDTERVMGWDIGGSGFRIVLARQASPMWSSSYLGDDVEDFLDGARPHDGGHRRLGRPPGGPKVLDAMQRRWTSTDERARR